MSVGKYEMHLPDPLTIMEGGKVATRAEWQRVRRSELLQLFREHVYGRVPDVPVKWSFEVFDEVFDALSGTAIRTQVAIHISTAKGSLRVYLLLYLPRSAREQPVPVMTLLNFDGNHTVHPDPAIAIAQNLQAKLRAGAQPQPNPEASRGMKASRFPIQHIIERGYGLVTAFCGDIARDRPDGFRNGIHALFDEDTERPPDGWGCVSAWAWGLSRIMDYLQTDPHVNRQKVAVLGHSRLGKAALWSGAQDERYGIVVSNDSGSTGAALARQKQGETIAAINKGYPHWFCENYKKYNDQEHALPVDQHMLIALMAPRPVYIASATEDVWADPKNEFLAAVHAEPVYRLFGLTGLGTLIMPSPDTPLNHGYIGYHIRTGKHDLTSYDWARFMDFADLHWK